MKRGGQPHVIGATITERAALGMWVLRQGLYKDYPRSARDSLTFVGPVGKPIVIGIKRRQLKYFLDDWFYSAWAVWRKFHLGLGLPYAGGWAEQPKHIVDIIEAFEEAYRGLQMAPGG